MTEIPEKYQGAIYAAVYVVSGNNGKAKYAVQALAGVTPDVFAEMQTQRMREEPEGRPLRNFPRISPEFLGLLERKVNELRQKGKKVDDITVEEIISSEASGISRQ